MNPMYLAYCKANQGTPRDQIEHDQKRWPGEVMTGYILWISERRKEFYKESPESFISRDRIADLDKWRSFVVRRGAEIMAKKIPKAER